jgi:hypothetical protein
LWEGAVYGKFWKISEAYCAISGTYFERKRELGWIRHSLLISEKVGKWENGIRGGFSGKMKMGANNTILNLIIF